jgi:5-methylcytosine-specific restriction endonuclease McrA
METLVLSSTYQPVARISWQRAITLLFLGKVEVIEEYSDHQVRSVSLSLNMPSVVRFLRFLRRHEQPQIRFCRENVYLRDGGKCQYCATSLSRREATLDHVLPRVRGGRSDWENIVLACAACNQKKGGRTPGQAKMRLLLKPARPAILPGGLRLTFTFPRDMPAPWRAWLSSLGKVDVDLGDE